MSDTISAFWSLFRERANDLAVARSADSAVYEQLLGQLQKIDRGLYMEFCSDPGECELIVTADGNQALFTLARTVVAAAPAIDGWKIRALKPKLGCPETACWEGLTLRIDGIVFDPLDGNGSEDLGLRIFVPGIEAEDVENAHSAVLRALDHSLGEEYLAQSVQFTELRPLPADAATDDYIPLRDLEKFIEWRKRRCKGAG